MKREWIFAGIGALLGGLLSGGGVFYFMRKQNKKQSMEFNDFVAEAFSKLGDDGKQTLREVMQVQSPSDVIGKYQKIWGECVSQGVKEGVERGEQLNVNTVNVMKKEFSPSKAMEEMTERMSLETKKASTDGDVVEIISYDDYGEEFDAGNGEYKSYQMVEYRWYSDRILCNELDEPVNARELLGDPIYAEYQDKYFTHGDIPDDIYVRVHRLELDIEIVGDSQSYTDDILPKLPRVGLEVGVTDPDDDPFKRTYDDYD